MINRKKRSFDIRTRLLSEELLNLEKFAAHTEKKI